MPEAVAAQPSAPVGLQDGDGAPLRVLVVCQNDFGAPTEKQALWLARELAGRGHRVLISIGGELASAQREGATAIDGIDVVRHSFAARRLRRDSARRAQAFRPDVIHAFNSRPPTVAAAAGYRRATGSPVLVHFEDDEWRRHPALPGEPLYRRAGRVGRRLASRVHPPLWTESTRASLRWARRRAAGFDALTPMLADEVSRRFERPCATVLPVNPPEATDPPPLGDVEFPAGQFALVTGTVWPIYLDDVLLGMRAVAELQRRGTGIAYVHAGRVHPRIDPAQLCAEAGLAPGTATFLGYVPFAQVPGLLRRATVLLSPGAPTPFNRLRLPAKLQAYLASGTPTVTFAVGFGELLEDRREALLTRTADPAELAARIAEVLSEPALAATLRAGGPRAARRLFDAGRNAEALVRLYRAALRAAGGPPHAG